VTWWSEHTVTGSLVFLAIFSVNMLAIAMDFPSAQFVALVVGVIAVVLGVMLIDLHWVSILPTVLSLERQLAPRANNHFYMMMAVAMGIIYVLVWFADVRNCYWRIRPNEIIHHHGFFRDKAEHYPAPGNLMQKDITDMFEFILLRSGRLIIHPQMGEDIILENVRRINAVEEKIQDMLNTRAGGGGDARHPGHRNAR